MNKKLSLSLVMVGLWGSSLLANPSSDYKQKRVDINPTQCEPSNGKRDMGVPPRGKRDSVIGMFHMLNFTQEQESKFQEIIKESERKRVYVSDAFTDDDFDKAKFIEIYKVQKDAKIEIDAEIIEKVYDILTVEQKSQFKTILDMQKIIMQKKMKHKGFINDKNRNGGR